MLEPNRGRRAADDGGDLRAYEPQVDPKFAMGEELFGD